MLWNNSNGFYSDPTAFIFSLRRNGTINNVQLRSGGTANDPTGEYSIRIVSSWGANLVMVMIYIFVINHLLQLTVIQIYVIHMTAQPVALMVQPALNRT